MSSTRTCAWKQPSHFSDLAHSNTPRSTPPESTAYSPATLRIVSPNAKRKGLFYDGDSVRLYSARQHECNMERTRVGGAEVESLAEKVRPTDQLNRGRSFKGARKRHRFVQAPKCRKAVAQAL